VRHGIRYIILNNNIIVVSRLHIPLDLNSLTNVEGIVDGVLVQSTEYGPPREELIIDTNIENNDKFKNLLLKKVKDSLAK
jgi:hypothetical protein